jgi:hypothetical protein
VDAIIQAVPELSDPVALSRSLSFLASSFPNKDPVLLLQENPQILLNLAESNMEDSAEVGLCVVGQCSAVQCSVRVQ